MDFVLLSGHIEQMFERISGPQHKLAIQVPRVPEGSRVYAIGDIHGRLDLLQKMHLLIVEDAKDFAGVRKALVYLGDYIDRGPQSRETVEHLIGDPLPDFERFYLMGNHERALLDFLSDSRSGRAWMAYGGGATLYSYGIAIEGPRMEAETLERAQEKFRACLPPRHLEFYQRLSLMHLEGDYLFVHAGVRPGVPLARQQEKDVLWIRGDFLESEESLDKVIVHGHTIITVPEVKKNRIGIDTGAFASGKLTCVALEGETARFLDTEKGRIGPPGAFQGGNS